jgi:hypothetical protein
MTAGIGCHLPAGGHRRIRPSDDTEPGCHIAWNAADAADAAVRPPSSGGARGSAGQANTTDPDHVWDGQGGTQTGPGAGGVGVTASRGNPGVDHAGGGGGAEKAYSTTGGGGGGGGWFGGGGGASGDLCTGAGGGGSGYAAVGISATQTAGVRSGNGQVTIAYPAPSGRPIHAGPVGHTRPTERAPAPPPW